MKYIDIRFEFDEEHEDDYTFYELARIHRLQTDMDDEDITRMTEMLAQSDKWHIDDHNGLIYALEGVPYVS
jgi:hypothetical protein